MLQHDLRPWDSEEHIVTDRLLLRNNVNPRRNKVPIKNITPQNHLPTFYYQFFSKIAQKRLGFIPTKHQSLTKHAPLKLPQILPTNSVPKHEDNKNQQKIRKKRQLRKKQKSQNWRKLTSVQANELGVFDFGDRRLNPNYLANYRS